MTLNSILVTELTDTMKSEEGVLYNFLSLSSHLKRFPVTSLRFTELLMAV